MTLLFRQRLHLVLPVCFIITARPSGPCNLLSPRFIQEIKKHRQSFSFVSGMNDQQPSPKRRRPSTKPDKSPDQKMSRNIDLTPVEKTLRLLLLDVVDFITHNAHENKESIDRSPSQLVLRFTGGWVRDKLLHVNSQDIDVGISNMTGYQFGLAMQEYLNMPGVVDKYRKLHADDKAFQNKIGNLHKIEANPEKSKHLETVTTKIFGLDIDLVNLRKETYTEESRNPQMDYGTPEEDALRRDATVNALFYNLHTEEVEDFTKQGLDDMAKKIIRTPLAPYQTFKDDPLRVLRLIRFASRLGYQIDPDAEKAMENPEIKETLNKKISRERVGKEIEKMLKGPDPCAAHHFIDRLGLFKTIFSSPNVKNVDVSQDLDWKAAYTGFHHLMNGPEAAENPFQPFIQNEEDLYHSWVLVAFVPWAHTSKRKVANEGAKNDVDLLVKMARESIKADNKISEILDGAVKNWEEITSVRDRVINMSLSELETRSLDHQVRGELGMAIRRWGRHWRLHTIFATLVEMASKSTSSHEITTDLPKWVIFVSYLKELDLLEAYSIRPIVNGNEIRKELGGLAPGPWMKIAVEMVVEWQFRNPNGMKEDALEEVKKRKSELGL